jgi:hypothetical protein
VSLDTDAGNEAPLAGRAKLSASATADDIAVADTICRRNDERRVTASAGLGGADGGSVRRSFPLSLMLRRVGEVAGIDGSEDEGIVHSGRRDVARTGAEEKREDPGSGSLVTRSRIMRQTGLDSRRHAA